MQHNVLVESVMCQASTEHAALVEMEICNIA